MLEVFNSKNDHANPKRYGKMQSNMNNKIEVGKKVTGNVRKKGTHMPTIIPEINDRIRQIRIDLGLTQKDFASMINLNLSSVKAIENKVVAPNIYTLLQIHNRCNKSFDYIMKGKLS